MSTSILNDVKHNLGLLEGDTSFDRSIIIYINSAISDATQLGVGPVEGYEIVDANNLWTEFIDDKRLNSVKSYIFLKVKLMFDPPLPSVITSMDRQIEEMGFRINSVVDYG